MNNSSTNDNSTLLLECLKPHIFSSSSEFFACYSLLYRYNWEKATAGIVLSVFAFLFNSLVIVLLVKMPHKKNIFEKILIAHCIVDGVTGLIDVPFFHITDLFGYWPFIRVGAYLWSSYDNAINVITNLHMLYMTWLRFRSIRAPNTFEKDLLAKKPELICVIIWIIGFTIWTPITFSFGLNCYSTEVDYNNRIVGTLLILFTWFLPLCSIIVISITILVILHKRIQQKRSLQAKARLIRSKSIKVAVIETTVKRDSRQSISSIKNQLIHLGPQTRFQIIIISYCLQWFPSSLIAIIDPLCNCISLNVTETVYWLTYTVCLTDPLVILIFNPNVSKHRARVSPH